MSANIQGDDQQPVSVALAAPVMFWGRGARTSLNGGRLFIANTGTPRAPRTERRADPPHSSANVTVHHITSARGAADGHVQDCQVNREFYYSNTRVGQMATMYLFWLPSKCNLCFQKRPFVAILPPMTTKLRQNTWTGQSIEAHHHYTKLIGAFGITAAINHTREKRFKTRLSNQHAPK